LSSTPLAELAEVAVFEIFDSFERPVATKYNAFPVSL
jgi:hypothetical protein